MSEQATDRGSVEVVGTAHVSAESVEEVERIVADRRPDVVAVELDDARYRQLQGEGPEDLDAGDLLRGNTVFQFLAYWMLSYVQSRLGDRFDITPGADMLAAVETAEEYDLDIALVDRDINVTIQRFWARLSGGEKLSLIAGLLLGIAPPLTLGAGVGLTFGVVFGLVLGTAGVGALGITTGAITGALGTTTVSAVGGLVGGAIGGIVLWLLAGELFGPALRAVGRDGPAARVAACAVVGVAVGLWLALTGGLSVGPLVVSTPMFVAVGGSALQFVLGFVVGLAVCTGLGLLAGALLEFLLDHDEDELEDFDISQMTDTDVVSMMMEEFRRFSPGGAEALIDERDAFIAHRLVDLREQNRNVVAVVGAGHRAGIERYLANPELLPPLDSISGVQKRSWFSPYTLFGYVFTLGFFVFFVLVAMAGVRSEALFTLFGAWFLINGIFAFGLAKLAGGHWVSAAVGGAVAWLTSVNPLLAPGWFAGYVELRYTTVNVGDIATLNEIMKDESAPIADLVARMREVPLFKLILVVALTNIGSMVASLLFVFIIIPNFFGSLGIHSAAGVADLMLDGARNSADAILRVIE